MTLNQWSCLLHVLVHAMFQNIYKLYYKWWGQNWPFQKVVGTCPQSPQRKLRLWSDLRSVGVLLQRCRGDNPCRRFSSLARRREVSGVVYVPGNMAASFRGRPIRSLRMRGKPEKLDAVMSVIVAYCETRFPQAADDPGVSPHRVLGVCFWQVGMTAERKMYRWIWPEVSFITSPSKRLLFKMEVELFCKHQLYKVTPQKVQTLVLAKLL